MSITDSSRKYIKFIVYLLVVVLLNVAGLTLFFRADLTRNKLYSLSEVSHQVVATLTEPMTIKVFFTRNLPAPHNGTERYLRDLMAEYGASANHFFNYRFYDVSPDQGDLGKDATENQTLAKDYGINPIQVQAVEKDEVKFQKAYMGLVIIHGDQLERVDAITSTDGLEYRLTMAMRKLNNKVSALLALTDKIHVRLYMSTSLKQVAPIMQIKELGQLPEKVKGIVRDLNRQSYGKLDFTYLDPATDTTLEKEIDQNKIMRLNWPDIPKEGIRTGSGAIGMVMAYGNRSVTIPVLQVIKNSFFGTLYQLADEKTLKEVISANMESLIDINRRIGVLTDVGSLPIMGDSRANPMNPRQASFNSFRTQAGQNYSLKAINIKADGIPDSFDCLVIPGPSKTFSDYDLFQIDQFLMKGKSLAIFLDPLKEVQPQQQAYLQTAPMGFVPLKSGLEKLLAHYGVTVQPAVVMDENCYKQRLPKAMGGGERPIYYAPVIKNIHINHKLAVMDNIKGLVTIKAAPVILDAAKIKAADLSAQPLFASSDRSWLMKKQINFDPRFLHPPGPDQERKSYPLAYMIDGEFPSYFAGKPIPEKPVKEKKEKDLKKSASDQNAEQTGDRAKVPSRITEKGNVIEKGKSGHLFIIGSTEIIRDNIMDPGGRSPNDIMVMNVLDYLNGQAGIAKLRSKQQTFNPIDETGAAAKTLVKTANIAGLPVLVVIFGLLVWLRRHGRKKRIQSMFMA